MKRHLLFVFSLLLIASMVLAACAQATPTQPPAAATQPPAQEQPTQPPAEQPTQPVTERAPVIRFATLEDLTTTNVWALFDDVGASYWNYVVQIYHWPTLFTLSDQRYDFIPAVAADFPSDFTQEGDLYVATVKLKDGLVWSDGSPVTAEDVAFTVNTVLKFKLGLNWQSGYNPDFLVKAEAVDPLTVKYYYNQIPGLSLWQYGALQTPFVSKAYWEPKVAEALAVLESDEYKALEQEVADLEKAVKEGTATQEELDAKQAELDAKLAEAVDILHKLDNEGEPTFGAWRLEKWEVGAFAENRVNENNFFIGTVVEEYANGAYREYKEDGSYEFVAYGTPEGEKVLEYKSGPYFDSALYTLYGNPDAAVLALRNNDVDFLLNPSGLQQGFVDQLKEDPNITIVENEQNGFRYLAFNQNRSYFKGEAGKALRQAIACMIDLDFLTERVLQGAVLPVYTLVPEGNGFWHNPDVPKWCVGDDTKTRMEKAVQILKDAGFTWEKEPTWNPARGGSVEYGQGLKLPNGEKFPEVKLLAPSAGYDPLRATTGVYIEQWMRQLGIPATAELTNFNNILSAVYDTGDYDMFILGWGLSIYPDYICTFFDSGVPTNPYGYESAALKEKCDAFLLETDVDKAKELAFEIQNILATELPYITLFTNPIYDAFRNLEYPYTEVLDGIGSGLYGAPTIAKPAAQ
ncbi:ABC transporter substrate-binding protein [Thermanaerothrix daxensis]|uniref:ABC transporter substrate-binding protein n=1 Tax=Thermanaerothrix daxensis TaxID=869279 RepID=UPI0006C9110B|nr:ABC transporter substrate-binding protein [Thermanaerothrix daxensis]